MTEPSRIHLQGVRVHNLKNIDLDLPKNKLVVFTGVSGSGKSSLAFDTLYAEGQRRYVESLSAYARQFLNLMPKPDCDHITGLSPAISIDQKTRANNPRSTIATITEIYDYMRVLYARVGVAYSPFTNQPITALTPTEIIERIQKLPEGKRVYILGPYIRDRKGEYRKELQELRKKGFQRVRLDGTLYEIEDVPTLDRNIRHSIEVVVDRLVLTGELKGRIADSVETALSIGSGLVWVLDADTDEMIKYSTLFSCPESGFTLDEIEPRLFSFNSPHGACPTCNGLGSKVHFDEELIVPDPSLSLKEGAVKPWLPYGEDTYRSICSAYGIKETTPFGDLPQDVKSFIFYGKESPNPPRTSRLSSFEGVIPNLTRRWHSTESSWIREELGRYQRYIPCHACQGTRLRPEALCVKIAELNIAEVTALSIEKAHQWMTELPKKLTPKQKTIATRLLKEISERLQFLVNVGLDYLTLNRTAGTLSGGESQRIRLASQIGSGLTGVLYVLDEPSIGLHQRDNDRLIGTLLHLRDLGNTVVVVEHDEDTIRASDHVVDVGPGAGTKGGQIVYTGPIEEIDKAPDSITGQFIRHIRQIPIPNPRRPYNEERVLTLSGANLNNLKNVKVSIPLGLFVCVTGVSGGGKSSLIMETLYPELHRILSPHQEKRAPSVLLEGLHHLRRVIDIDQSPIGRTPRSNALTYTGGFTPIRDLFAQLPESKARGYGVGRFSFNVRGGRCESCQGDGMLKVEMHFLPDVFVECDQCRGQRYNRETLEIKYKDKNIADVLKMTVAEGCAFFEGIPTVADKLKLLSRVGLDYLPLGQSATTLSGGEAQRIKLAKELSKRSDGRTLYILDEPTTGLHFEDTKNLLVVLQALVEQGNTVLVIEHNMDVIKTADWVIDLGPEGGDKGGQIVAEGTPEDIAKVKASHTGAYLKRYFT